MNKEKNNHPLFSILKERIVILDGATGTEIQTRRLDEQAYRGERFINHPVPLIGCHDVLCLTQPKIIEAIHRDYLDADADIIETNSFNATSLSLSDYQLQDHVFEINQASAKIAVKAAAFYSQKDKKKPRFVAGSMGPTNRSATLSPDVDDPSRRNVTFDELVLAYSEQARGLLAGGIDLFLVETVFDTLNCKAALFAIESVFQKENRAVPIIISATVADKSGRNLSGQTIEAFWISVAHTRPLAIGLNCASGAKDMRPFIEELSGLVPCFVSCYPNAGLPNELGAYDQSPKQMAKFLEEFAAKGLVNLVGGCCGTRPDHIRAIADKLRNIPPRSPKSPIKRPAFSGLEPLVIGSKANFVNIGERTNVAGSKKFRNLIVEEKFEQALSIARQQVEAGAQVIDVNMDEPLLDSRKTMVRFLRLLSAEPDIARVPLMIDSSRFDVIEGGLKCAQGKSIVNSISLKEGEENFKQQARLIKRLGAAVVVMAFDEKGQATSAKRKVEICKRAYRLLHKDLEFPAEDIIFDPNVLTVATGMKEHNRCALDFFKAVKEIKKSCPGALVSGGISNVSFALRGHNTIREAMHSIFLFHAIKNGLDMGIVNPGITTVYDKIPKNIRQRIEDVYFDRRPDATDRLIALTQEMESQKTSSKKELSWRKLPVEKRLTHALIKGTVDFIEKDLDETCTKIKNPLRIIEGPLMDGMKKVGELFGCGKMFLPQVIKSARVMKKAVGYLQPHMEQHKTKSKNKPAGKILLATVKGDVHDIGKNIAGVVLACNNFVVIDLGIMVPGDKIVEAARKRNVDLVGLSGLITPSLEEMSRVAQKMQNQGLRIPLLIGGATTSPQYTAIKIAKDYRGFAVHVKDASLSATIASKLIDPGKKEEFIKTVSAQYEHLYQNYEKSQAQKQLIPLKNARSKIIKIDWQKADIPVPTFYGAKSVHCIRLSDLISYINWTPFFHAWELRGVYPALLSKGPSAKAAQALFQDAQEMLNDIVKKNLLTIKGTVGFFQANSKQDDVWVYPKGKTDRFAVRFAFLRQQYLKDSDHPLLCLSDFIAPKHSGLYDTLGLFAVTTGLKIEKSLKFFQKDNDDYRSILLKSLADRLAEAFAEKLHEIVRKQLWGYAKKENLSKKDLWQTRYQGIRPAPGYPACPDHTQKNSILKLLGGSKQTKIKLTTTCMMRPAASICGFYFSHPQSCYFSLGKIGKDQVKDYAKRLKMPIKKVEKNIGAQLAY